MQNPNKSCERKHGAKRASERTRTGNVGNSANSLATFPLCENCAASFRSLLLPPLHPCLQSRRFCTLCRVSVCVCVCVILGGVYTAGSSFCYLPFSFTSFIRLFCCRRCDSCVCWCACPCEFSAFLCRCKLQFQISLRCPRSGHTKMAPVKKQKQLGSGQKEVAA